MPESCEFCDFQCNDIKSDKNTQIKIKNHVSGVHMRSQYKCDLCGYQSLRKQEVYRHIDQAHKDHLGQVSSDQLKALKRSHTRVICPKCELEEDSFYKMLDHMKQQHNEFLLFNKGRRRGNSNLQSHRRRGERNSNLQSHKCSECDFQSKTLLGITDHLKNDHPDFRYQCQKCKSSYSNFSAFNRHMKEKHERIRLFACTFCERKFKRTENLRDHSLRVHGSTGEY